MKQIENDIECQLELTKKIKEISVCAAESCFRMLEALLRTFLLLGKGEALAALTGRDAPDVMPVLASRKDFPGSPPAALALLHASPPHTCGPFALPNLPKTSSRFLQGRSPSFASEAQMCYGPNVPLKLAKSTWQKPRHSPYRALKVLVTDGFFGVLCVVLFCLFCSGTKYSDEARWFSV